MKAFRKSLCIAISLLVSAGSRSAIAAGPPAPQNLRVLDVLRVSTEGDASDAVVQLKPGPVHEVRCDVAIIGAGMGGTSAALAATKQGLRVCMTEPKLWVGGQMTSEGVSAFDDNQFIETTGATASYMDLSRRIREHYAALRKDTSLTASAAAGSTSNPGGCWVSRLCFEPAPAERILQTMLQPAIASGRLHLWLHTVPVKVERNGRIIRSVLVYDLERSRWIRIKAQYFVDASEMGDLLPLLGIRYRMGAESHEETLERDAPPQEDRRAAQSFTYTFLLEYPAHAASESAQP